MREMLGVTGAIVGAGLSDSVALLTDGRLLRDKTKAKDAYQKYRELRSRRRSTK